MLFMTRLDIQFYINLEGSLYFKDSRFSSELSKLIFMLRTRMYDIKFNFRNKYINTDLKCRLCQTQDESMEHIYQCDITIRIMGPLSCLYEDIFSENIEIVMKTAKKTEDLVKLRHLLFNP